MFHCESHQWHLPNPLPHTICMNKCPHGIDTMSSCIGRLQITQIQLIFDCKTARIVKKYEKKIRKKHKQHKRQNKNNWQLPRRASRQIDMRTLYIVYSDVYTTRLSFRIISFHRIIIHVSDSRVVSFRSATPKVQCSSLGKSIKFNIKKKWFSLISGHSRGLILQYTMVEKNKKNVSIKI